jgi:hypothetical protein
MMVTITERRILCVLTQAQFILLFTFNGERQRLQPGAAMGAITKGLLLRTTAAAVEVFTGLQLKIHGPTTRNNNL